FDTKKGELIGKLTSLDKERIEIEERIAALHRLMPKKSSSVDNLIALNIAGLEVSYYMSNVDKLDNLEIRRQEMLKVYKSNTDEIRDIDRQIGKTRNDISNVVNAHLQKLSTDLSQVNAKLAESEFEAKDLPFQEIEFVEANRGFELNSVLYSNLINQLNTTDLSLASIVSDISIIDPAKNQGQGSIYPNPQRNYLIALGIGLLIPLVYVIIKELLDFKVRVLKDITSRTGIPIIGLVGPLGDNSPLVVINNPKSGISESFRSIRSNLKFIYKDPGLNQSNKTILVTSFIGGEGKTFNAMNIASSLGSMDKKTVLIGLDLRKPKIFDDFNINNKVGVTD
ncbi:MAG: GNVR domain-containing protein, partial [Algoriella sp.]